MFARRLAGWESQARLLSGRERVFQREPVDCVCVCVYERTVHLLHVGAIPATLASCVASGEPGCSAGS